MTEAQLKGLKSLKKRVKEGQIVICKTDKSGKFGVASLEAYKQMGEVHTRGDEEIGIDRDIKSVSE